MERVHKILSNRGFCSRRKAESLIEQGRVRVNGEKITIGDKAEFDDKITVDDKLIKKAEPCYIIFNKPVKCVTAVKDKHYKTVMNFVKVKQRVYPVGRLDYNTSGLLILTNDGDLANKIMHPSHGSVKVYEVGLQQKLTKEHAEKIRKGIKLDDGIAKAEVKARGNTAEVKIHIGRNRVVRRLFKTLGYNIGYLHRKSIGNLTLGSLKEGQYKIVPKRVVEKALG
ncbi:MAG: pseudouridine synthase [Candidatus Nanoarchaeia archaeon]